MHVFPFSVSDLEVVSEQAEGFVCFYVTLLIWGLHFGSSCTLPLRYVAVLMLSMSAQPIR